MVSFPGLGTCGSLIDGEGSWQHVLSVRGRCFLAQADDIEFTILQPPPPCIGVHIPTSRFYLVLRTKPRVLQCSASILVIEPHPQPKWYLSSPAQPPLLLTDLLQLYLHPTWSLLPQLLIATHVESSPNLILSYTRRTRQSRRQEARLVLLQDPSSLSSLAHTQASLPLNWEEAESRWQPASQPASSPLLPPAHPRTPRHGPPYLHEASMVLQHTACCLPGVLVALPRVHPAVTREAVLSFHSCTRSIVLPPRAQGAYLASLVMLCA